MTEHGDEAASNGLKAPASRRIRRPKTGELIAGQIRRDIVTGKLREGDKLPTEAELLETFGVSRPTLREAFRVLEAEGLISVRSGARGGAQIHVPNGSVAGRYAGLVLQAQSTTLDDVYLARAVIEPPLVARVAENATDEQIARLYSLCDAAEAVRVGETAGILERNATFHKELVAMYAPKTLLLFVEIIDHILREAARSFVVQQLDPVAQHEGGRNAATAHRLVVDRIADRDPDGASKLWREHVEDTAQLVLTHPGAKTVVDLLTPDVVPGR